jgi:type IV pilus assembly protein PilY1
MRKTKKCVVFFLFLLLPFIPSTGYGLDTDLYVLTGANVPPNVLIILDSSASMDEVSSGQLYSSAIDYSPYVPSTGTIYPMNQAYIKSTGNKWIETSIPGDCTALQDLLNQFGEAINFSGCGYKNKDFQIGNFRNYLQATGGPGGSRPRFGLATGIIHSYINTTSGVRFAVMAFNRDKDGNTVRNNNGAEFVSNDEKDDPQVTPWDAVGGRLLGFVDENKNGKTALFNELAKLKNDSWSPLAETLYEAGIYFQKGSSAITGTNYNDTPIIYYCQKNYVLIISDGFPTKDNDPGLNGLIPDLNSNGKVDLDEVAKYLYGLDLNGELNGKQNIKTYTIGFSMTQPLLEATARNGGGKYFYVWSSQSFNIAFQSFISEVLDESVSYVAPVVPISQMEKTSAGNLMYLAMFKPTEKSFWRGNIKKYCIATVQMNKASANYGKIVDCEDRVVGANIKVGDILDLNGLLVMDSNNEIKKTAQSYWSSVVDREYTDAGGVGEKLRTTSRNIYTYFGTNINLKDSSNAFTLSNGAITPELLGLAPGDIVGREALIKFIQGYDSYYENEIYPKGPDNKKDWVLGAFIHSRPVVVHYGDRSVIYAGANDGMLHAFDDKTGEELWGFIPRNLLPKLKNLRGEAIEFFVDGAPKVYIERDAEDKLTKAILIFGQRRGGDRYIALNVKDPENPEFLWEISPSAITYQKIVTNSTDYQEMGQTWSSPQLGKIKYGGGEKWVAFISGGYDENQDNSPVVANDTKGRAIYIVDIFNGNRIWSYTVADNSNMKYCIPSDIARVDTNGDKLIDRLYVGDIGGQIWRFEIGELALTGKIIFDSNFGEAVKRKIFYPPDVTLEKENYEMIFFGTGDREHPKDITKINRLYGIKDKNPSSPLKESDLYDATQDLLQEGDYLTEFVKLKTSSGWYIKLNEEGHAGEKCLSNSVLFYGVVYYTTFQPTFDPSGNDPCFLSEGIARLYAVDYRTGNAVFNLDGMGTIAPLTRSDRSTEMGTSIPSGVIITFIGGTSVAYGGIGGGVYRPPIPISKTIIPINWRIVF